MRQLVIPQICVLFTQTYKTFNMKKIALLFLAVTATVFTTSCGNDDEAAVSVVGNWKLIAETEGGVDANISGCELDQEITFAASTGALKVLDDDTPPCSFDNLPFTYTLSGSDLELTISGIISVTADAVVEELTATTLRFRIVSDSFSGAYDPEDIVVQTFTRQ